MKSLGKKTLSLAMVMLMVTTSFGGSVSTLANEEIYEVINYDVQPESENVVVDDTNNDDISNDVVEIYDDVPTVDIVLTDDSIITNNDTVTSDTTPVEVVEEIPDFYTVTEHGKLSLDLKNSGGKVIVRNGSDVYSVELINNKAVVKDQWENTIPLKEDWETGYIFEGELDTEAEFEVIPNEGFVIKGYTLYVDGNEYPVAIIDDHYLKQKEKFTTEYRVIEVEFDQLPTVTEELNKDERDESPEQVVEESGDIVVSEGNTEEKVEVEEDVVNEVTSEEAVVDEVNENTDKDEDVVDEDTATKEDVANEDVSNEDIATEENVADEDTAIKEDAIDDTNVVDENTDPESTSSELENGDDIDAEETNEEVVSENEEVVEIEIPVTDVITENAGRFANMGIDEIKAYLTNIPVDEREDFVNSLTSEEIAYLYMQAGITKDSEEAEKTVLLSEVLEILAEKEDLYAVNVADFPEVSSMDFSSGRLIIGATSDSIFVDKEPIISENNGLYLLQFNSIDTTIKAYAYYRSVGAMVIPDNAVLTVDNEEYVEEVTEEISNDEKVVTNEENAEVIITNEENLYTCDDIQTEEFVELVENSKVEEEVVADVTDVMTEDNNPITLMQTNETYESFDIALIDTGANGADMSISVVGEDVTDYNGHGSLMLSKIREQNPNARVLSIKAFNDDGSAYMSAVYSAIQYAINHNVRIINISASSINNSDKAMIVEIISIALSQGIQVVASAGNSGSDAYWFIPASIDGVLTIGACDENGERLSSSNYGDCVEYNVVANSTSEAAALFSGWLSLNSLDNIESIINNGLIYETGFDGSSVVEQDEAYIEQFFELLNREDVTVEEIEGYVGELAKEQKWAILAKLRDNGELLMKLAQLYFDAYKYLGLDNDEFYQFVEDKINELFETDTFVINTVMGETITVGVRWSNVVGHDFTYSYAGDNLYGDIYHYSPHGGTGWLWSGRYYVTSSDGVHEVYCAQASAYGPQDTSVQTSSLPADKDKIMTKIYLLSPVGPLWGTDISNNYFSQLSSMMTNCFLIPYSATSGMPAADYNAVFGTWGIMTDLEKTYTLAHIMISGIYSGEWGNSNPPDVFTASEISLLQRVANSVNNYLPDSNPYYQNSQSFICVQGDQSHTASDIQDVFWVEWKTEGKVKVNQTVGQNSGIVNFTKAVTSSDANDKNVAFTYNVYINGAWSSSFTLSANGGTKQISVPAGATYRIVETVPSGWKANASEVSGTMGSKPSLTVSYSWSGDGKSGSFTITDNGSYTIEGITAGQTVTITPTNPGGNWSSQSAKTSGAVVADSTIDAGTFSYTYTPSAQSKSIINTAPGAIQWTKNPVNANGNLTIRKSTVPSGDTKNYSFTLKYGPTSSYGTTTTFTLNGSNNTSKTFSLAAGTYWEVTENDYFQDGYIVETSTNGSNYSEGRVVSGRIPTADAGNLNYTYAVSGLTAGYNYPYYVNGTYTGTINSSSNRITAKGGATIKVTGIHNGSSITISEVAPSAIAGGTWSGGGSLAAVTIEAGKTKSAGTLTNTWTPTEITRWYRNTLPGSITWKKDAVDANGNLVIHKSTVPAGDTRKYEFTLETGTNTNYTGTKYEFTLDGASQNSKTYSLPAGTYWRITEKSLANEGYITETSTDGSTYTENRVLTGRIPTVQAETLTYEYTVTGLRANYSYPYYINGTYTGTITSTNNKIRAVGDKTIKVGEIHAGSSIKITETTPTAVAGGTWSGGGSLGAFTIEADKNKDAGTITNTWTPTDIHRYYKNTLPGYIVFGKTSVDDTGSIKVTKSVARGSESDKTVKEFEMQFDIINNSSQYAYKIYNNSGSVIKSGNISANGGKFKLKNTEYIIISGIPTGSSYTITELANLSAENDEMYDTNFHNSKGHEDTGEYPGIEYGKVVHGIIPERSSYQLFDFVVTGLDRANINYYVYENVQDALNNRDNYIESGTVSNNQKITISRNQYVRLKQIRAYQNVKIVEQELHDDYGTWTYVPTNRTKTQVIAPDTVHNIGTYDNTWHPREHDIIIRNERKEADIKVIKESTNNDCFEELETSNNLYSQDLTDAKFRLDTIDVNTGSVVNTEDINATNYNSERKYAYLEGTYWVGDTVKVTEITAPKGYTFPSVKTQSRVIRAYDGTSTTLNTYTFSDTPLFDRSGIQIQKVDENGNAVKNDRVSLSAPIFKITYYNASEFNSLRNPVRYWYVKADANGYVSFPNITEPISWQNDTSSELYTDANGNVALPLGIYTIQEVEAPNGFKTESYIGKLLLYQSANGSSTVSRSWDMPTPNVNYTNNVVSYEDAQLYGSIEIKKEDLEGNYVQGDSDFNGIQVTIYNNSGTTIYLKGNRVGIPNGGVVCTLEFGKDGDTDDVVSTKNFFNGEDSIPIGKDGTYSYTVKETKTNQKYLLNSDWLMKVKMVDNNVKHTTFNNLPLEPVYSIINYGLDITSHTSDDNAVNNQIVKGGLRVVKVDEDRERSGDTSEITKGQGYASLQGAEFTIYNISEESAMNYQAEYSTQRVLSGRYDIDSILARSSSAESYVMQRIVTDSNGIATTGQYDLPYGTYLVLETVPPIGYNLNKDYCLIIQIRENGVIVDTSNNNNVSGGFVTSEDLYMSGWKSVEGKKTGNNANADDPIIRGTINIQKNDYDSQNTKNGDDSLAGIKFAVVFEKNIEAPGSQNSIYVPSYTEGGNLYRVGQIVSIVTTNENGFASTGKILPYGYYSVYELDETSTLKVGDTWNGQKPVRFGDYANTSHSYLYDINNTTNVFIKDEGMAYGIIYENVKTNGYIEVQKNDYDYSNGDYDVNSTTPQGDSSFEGIKIAIVNRSDNYVFYPANNRYANNQYNIGTVVDILITDENGYAKSLALPYGTYDVIELKEDSNIKVGDTWSDDGSSIYSNKNGYLRDENIVTVEIREEQKTYHVDFVDNIVRANIIGQKWDAEIPFGYSWITRGLSLEGAEITIVNASENAVVNTKTGKLVATSNYTNPTWNDIANAPSDFIYDIVKTEDKFGHFTIEDVPYGTYYLVESDVPVGYRFNKTWIGKVEVRKDGITYNCTRGDQDLCDLPYRTDFIFKKYNEDGTPRAYTPFVITLYDDNGNPLSYHVFVTDENGEYNSKTKEFRHLTNGAGGFVGNELDRYSVNGQYVKNGVLSNGTPEDSEVAIWFGSPYTPESGGGALTYGYYDIQELQTPASIERGETMQFSHFSINTVKDYYQEYYNAVNKKGTNPDKNSEEFEQDDVFMASFIDLQVDLSTDAKDSTTGTQNVIIGDAVNVVDTITFNNLDIRNTYKWVVTFKDAETDDVLGQTIVDNFVPERTNPDEYETDYQDIDIPVTIDTSRYDNVGGEIYATVELYMYYEEDYSGRVNLLFVNSHNMDNSDPEERLFVPTISTEAEDVMSKDHVGTWGVERNIDLANENGIEITAGGIQDTITINNIAGEGSTYKFVAEVIDNDTGEVFTTGEYEYTINSEDGYVEEEVVKTPIIDLGSDEFRNKQFTIYEYLYLVKDENDILLNTHIEDGEFSQSTYYPDIDTEAKAYNGLHGAEAKKGFVLTDKVSMVNLVKDEDYTLKGILMDQDTNEPLLDDNGETIEATLENFVATDTEQDEDLVFTFDILDVATEKDDAIHAVVFVELLHNGYLVSEHKHIDDADELVKITPPPYKHYQDDSEYTENTYVTVEDVIPYKVTASQVQYNVGNVVIVDTLSEGLDYVSGSSVVNLRGLQNSLTGSSEPSISSDGKVLTWVFENVELGAWIEIDYSVSVNETIITYPSVNNSVVIEVTDLENPESSVTILESNLENMGEPRKIYDNTVLNQDVDVLNNDTIVYTGKNIEYQLQWVNPYDTEATVVVTDTLSGGLGFNSDISPVYVYYNSGIHGNAEECIGTPEVIKNADETTTVKWSFTAKAHEWGTINYVTTVNENAATEPEKYQIVNEYNLSVNSEDDETSWDTINKLENPVPHYTVNKYRITDAPMKEDTNKYGFKRGDVVEYEVVVTNDGGVDLTFDLRGIFAKDGIAGSGVDAPITSMFKDYQITEIIDGNGETLDNTGDYAINTDVSLPVGTSATIKYQATVNLNAIEFLADDPKDNLNTLEDGYINYIVANSVTASYIDNDGNVVKLVGGEVEINEEDGTEVVDDNNKVIMKQGQIYKGTTKVASDVIPELRDKTVSSNTPVQVTAPSYTVVKNRITDAPIKLDSEKYGFTRNDLVEYEVIVTNTGNSELELDVDDMFNTEGSGDTGIPSDMFSDITLVDYEGDVIGEFSDTKLRFNIPLGESVRVVYSAKVDLHALEFLADTKNDDTGYLNTAKVTNVVAIYHTNDNKYVRINSVDCDEDPGTITTYNLDENGNIIEDSKIMEDLSDEDKESWIPGIRNFEDISATPVQTFNPDVKVIKTRVTESTAKTHSDDKAYGFFRGDLITYTVEVENTGNVDLVLNVDDKFEDSISNYFTNLHITKVVGSIVEEISNVEVRLYVPAHEKATVTYEAFISLLAKESLARVGYDETKELLGDASAEELEKLLNDPQYDSLGYLNKATVSKMLFTYKDNQNKPVVVYGPDYEDKRNITEVYPEGTDPIRNVVDPEVVSEPNPEYAEIMANKTDSAHTSVADPKPGYSIEKVRITDAIQKFDGSGYGLKRNDKSEYKVIVTNTGDVDLEVTISDEFSDEVINVNGQDVKASDMFNNLHITNVEGNEIKRIDFTSTRVELPVDSVVTVYYSAGINGTAVEYLAPTVQDDPDNNEDGYQNIAKVSDVTAVWTTNTGRVVKVGKDTPDGGLEEYLQDITSITNTPVVEFNPGYTITKELETEYFGDGFNRGDSVVYKVTVENTGDLDLEVTVNDSFSNKLINGYLAYKNFENLQIIDVEGTELERIDNTTTRLDLPIGSKSVVTYYADVKEDAKEYLIVNGEGGYLNTATAKDVVGKYTNNLGYVVRVTKDSNNGEFADVLGDKEDSVNTPVLVREPSYTLEKIRVTDASEKLDTGLYGFKIKDSIIYEVTVTNTGDIDLIIDVEDAFSNEIIKELDIAASECFEGLSIVHIDGNEVSRISDTKTKVLVPVGEDVKVYYIAKVTPEAKEFLSKYMNNDPDGYFSVATSTNAIAQYTSNTGKVVTIDQNTNHKEFYQGLKDRTARTASPVQIIVPNYTVNKEMITEVPVKYGTDSYGFNYLDTVEYEVTVENTGELDLEANITDEFEEADYFDSLKIVDITYEDGSSLIKKLSDTEVEVNLPIGSKVIVKYSAIVGNNTPEKLMSGGVIDGYKNTAIVKDVKGIYTNNTGEVIEVTKVDYDELEDKISEAYTPVQRLNPSFAITKERITNAPNKVGTSKFGFKAGDKVLYKVVVTNTGNVDLRLNVKDSYHPKYEKFFKDVHMVSIEGVKEWTRISLVETLMYLNIGETATLVYEATVTNNAFEVLSSQSKDNGVGFKNTALGCKASGFYTTNTGELIEITVDNYEGLSNKEDVAFTPTQIPNKEEIVPTPVEPIEPETSHEEIIEIIEPVTEPETEPNIEEPTTEPETTKEVVVPSKPNIPNIPSNPESTKIPSNPNYKTGDENNMILWLSLVGIALVVGVIGVVILKKKKSVK